MRRAVLPVLALVVGAALGWAAQGVLRPAAPAPAPRAGSTPALDSLSAHVLRVRGHFEQLREPTSDEENRLRRPRTPSYTLHLDRADSLGVLVPTEADLARQLRAGRLVPLVDNEYYVVRILEHSKPFVLPALRERVDEVGRRFQAALDDAGLPPYRLTISSALRTADLQRELGQTNRNATAGRSSHEYGASVDLVYSRYSLRPSAADTLALPFADAGLPRAQRLATRWADDLAGVYDDRLFGVLARVLHEMQREDRLLVLLEDEQPVFHITLDTPDRPPPPPPPDTVRAPDPLGEALGDS